MVAAHTQALNKAVEAGALSRQRAGLDDPAHGSDARARIWSWFRSMWWIWRADAIWWAHDVG